MTDHATAAVASTAEEYCFPLKWPAHFPVGCPDSKPIATIRLYHLAGYAPPSNDDPLMKSATENNRFKGADPCERASLSCYDDVEKVKLKRSLPQNATTVVVAVDMKPDYGRAMQTGKDPNHWSVWLLATLAYQPSHVFKVVP